MKKVIFSMAIFAMAAMAFTGCSEKEENPYYGQTTNFTLSVADMNGQKAHMEGNFACWDNGDYVLINDRPFEVTVSDNKAALINGVPVADAYYAIYPIDDVRSDAGATTSVELPESYLYGEDNNGNQLSPAPLMACKASPAEPKDVAGQLSFYSVCTQWKVTVPAYTNKIVVKTTNTVITGEGTVTIPDNGNPSLAMNADGGKEITVEIPEDFISDAAKTIYVPVPAIANGDEVCVMAYTTDNKMVMWDKTAQQAIPVHYVLSLDMTTNAEYYQFVTAIGSNSQAYINTGVDGNAADLVISGKFKFGAVTNYAAVFGNYCGAGETGEGNMGWRLIQTNNTNNAFYANNYQIMNASEKIGYGTTATDCYWYKTQIHQFRMDKDGIYMSIGDGDLIAHLSNANTRTVGTLKNANIALFNRGVGSSATTISGTNIRIYSFQIANSTKGLIRDFVPCIKHGEGGTVIGMLDKVNGQFYANAGSGSFTVYNE